MSASLYTIDILRLAGNIPHAGRLAAPMGSSEKRSPVCGSVVSVDVDLDECGCISDVGMLVQACAFGQASSSLLAAHAIGRTPEEVAVVRDALTAWLTGDGGLPAWPGIDQLAPALSATGRHAAIRLAFEAAAEAAAEAGNKALIDG